MIKIQIDVSKVDKSRLYKGAKGTYLNAVLIPTPDSQYGDYMIIEEVTREERDAGKKGTILGNGKEVKARKAEPPASDFSSPPPPIDEQTEDELPF